MPAKMTFYAPEEAAETNEFVEWMLDKFMEWDSGRGKRSAWPTISGQLLRRNEYGIGLVLSAVPVATPAQFAGVRPTRVIIEEDYVDDDGVLEPGLFKRGTSIAVVRRRTDRPSDGRGPHVVLRIDVSGTSVKSVSGLYFDIRAGLVEPTEHWSRIEDAEQ